MHPIDDWRKDLYALLSHDLRTPIRNIQTFAEILGKQLLSEQQIKEIAANIFASAEEQHYILEHALNILRIDDFQQGGAYPMSLTTLIEESVEAVASLAKAKSIHFEKNVQYEGFTEMPSQLLRQVMNNLLSNAVKFSNPDSTVTIGVRRQWGAILIDIADTGIGFRPEWEESLFDRYNSLGLHFNRKLIRQYQGDLSAHSSGEGKGATFTLCLPPAAEEKE